MKRYPPPFPEREPVELDYHDPRPGGVRRRWRHPILFPALLVAGALVLVAVLYYVGLLALVFMRGMDQD